MLRTSIIDRRVNSLRARSTALLAASVIGLPALAACSAAGASSDSGSPNGSGEPRTVAIGSAVPSRRPALRKATAAYHDYVVTQAGKLVDATKQFAAAVQGGELQRAKQLYAPTRTYYERIEPVAESFGDLDPAIDARAGDVADRSKWTGFHRIEKALWVGGSTEGMGPVAKQLVADVHKLRTKVRSVHYQPAQLANGAVALLDEVAKSKITGEEERYSHTDAADIAANVTGARKAYELLQPVVKGRRPQLAKTITRRFDEVEAQLKPLRNGGGFVDWTAVEQPQRRDLAQRIDALAKPLSQLAAVVVD
jgi:iron uptake system component EfeO